MKSISEPKQVSFTPYNDSQIMEIIKDRLLAAASAEKENSIMMSEKPISSSLMQDKAIELCAKKVAACNDSENSLEQQQKISMPEITITHINQIINTDIIISPITNRLRSLNHAQSMALFAIVCLIKKKEKKIDLTKLVAHNRDDEKIAQEIGADKVIYQELDDLIESCRKFNRNILNFD
ncbi:14533_t:CDS:2 [Entrophospora sp. SA101]|nr:14533_t:CDS:2 [Entrophospora sp. SA101]